MGRKTKTKLILDDLKKIADHYQVPIKLVSEYEKAVFNPSNKTK